MGHDCWTDLPDLQIEDKVDHLFVNRQPSSASPVGRERDKCNSNVRDQSTQTDLFHSTQTAAQYDVAATLNTTTSLASIPENLLTRPITRHFLKSTEKDSRGVPLMFPKALFCAYYELTVDAEVSDISRHQSQIFADKEGDHHIS